MAAQIASHSTNLVNDRARQEDRASILASNVALDGASGPRMDIRMTGYAHDLLATTLDVYGLQEHRRSEPIDEVVRIGLLFHEHQG